MGKILIPGSSGGGVGSDDVTAGKAQVLQGYRTITSDSDDEVVEGSIQVVDTSQNNYTKTRTTEYGLDKSRSTFYMHLPQRSGYYTRSDNTPHVEIDSNSLGDALPSDVVDTKTASSKNGVAMRGTLQYKGNGGAPNGVVCPEMFYHTLEGAYVARFDAGAYYNTGERGQWKPYVSVPVWMAKQATNYHPEKTLSDTVTCQERGTVKMIDTKLNNYTNNQARNIGIDSGRGKLWMELGHGNAYYYRDDNAPHVETDASKFGTADANSVLQWQTASSQHGLKFEGTIPRWICSTGDVISAVNNEGFAWDDTHAGRGRGIVVKIPNGHYIQGANWVFLPAPYVLSENIREGVNMFGVPGGLPDYRIGRPVFRNATFNTIYVSGVANKDFPEANILRDRSVSVLNYSRYTGGTTISLQGGNNYHFFNNYAGFVLDKAILFTFFKQIKVKYKLDVSSNTTNTSRAAGVEVFVGLYNAANRRQVLADASKEHRYYQTQNYDGGVYEFVIDTSAINTDAFIALCAVPFSDYNGASITGSVTFTDIELIN